MSRRIITAFFVILASSPAQDKSPDWKAIKLPIEDFLLFATTHNVDIVGKNYFPTDTKLDVLAAYLSAAKALSGSTLVEHKSYGYRISQMEDGGVVNVYEHIQSEGRYSSGHFQIKTSSQNGWVIDIKSSLEFSMELPEWAKKNASLVDSLIDGKFDKITTQFSDSISHGTTIVLEVFNQRRVVHKRLYGFPQLQLIKEFNSLPKDDRAQIDKLNSLIKASFRE